MIFHFDNHTTESRSISWTSQTWHVFKFQHCISHHFQWHFNSFQENKLLTWWWNEFKFKLCKVYRNGCDLRFDVFVKLRSEPPCCWKKEGFPEHFLGANLTQINSPLRKTAIFFAVLRFCCIASLRDLFLHFEQLFKFKTFWCVTKKLDFGWEVEVGKLERVVKSDLCVPVWYCTSVVNAISS